MSFYLNLNEEIKPLLLSEIRIRSYSLPDQQGTLIDKNFYPLLAFLFDYEKKKSKEKELIDEEIVVFLNQIRNSNKDARDEIQRRFVQRVNFDIKKIERILLKFDNGYYDRIYEEENFTLTPEEEKLSLREKFHMFEDEQISIDNLIRKLQNSLNPEENHLGSPSD